MIEAILKFLLHCHHRRLSRPVGLVRKHGIQQGEPYVVCLDCDARFPRAEIDQLNREHCPPSCPSCGRQFLKPTVVLFGEALPQSALRQAQLLAMAADVVLIVGSSLQVYPAAGIPRLARQHGAELCIINAEPTPYDDVAAAVIHGKAGEVLPAVVRRIAQEGER